MKNTLPTRLLDKPSPECRLAAGFSPSEHPKPVTDRRSARSPVPSGREISGLKPLTLAACALIWCALNLHAQPVIINQPASQTNLPGTSVSFSVVVDGTGPFTYQWQFNGASIPDNIITTVAANGSATYAGDGKLATIASLYHPSGVALDAAGNLFIADYSNFRIRKVDINGIITTVAGKSAPGYSGDGGVATNASLNYPFGVACDAFGNLFIADSRNYRIRKVDINGIITTVAGKSAPGYSGDGSAATNASLNNPQGVAFDLAGNLYIADTVNNRIRKVDTNGIITTVAGKSGSGYSGDGGAATNASVFFPEGVSCDDFGNLYIADTDNNRIRKVDTNGIITSIAGKSGSGYSGDGGVATNASLNQPYGVGLDAAGNLYIADYNNERIRKVLLDAGNPTFTLTQISATNAGDYTVVVTSSSGSVTSAIATLTVATPAVIAVQPASQITALGGKASFLVAVIGPGPFGYEWFFAGTNLLQTGINSTLTLSGISTNNAGNYTVVVTNTYGSTTSQIATLTVALPPIVTFQPASQTNLAGTTVSFNVTAGGIGPFSYQWQFNGTNLPNNIITTVAGNGGPYYLGDGGAATSAGLSLPSGIVFDAAGNLYIADTDNNRIRKVDTNGIIATVAGKNSSSNYSGDGGAATNASLFRPENIALDSSGNLYIADAENNRVRKVDTNGIIITVAGNGPSAPANGSYSGDGGAATNASLFGPVGVGFDTSGNLYIADGDNNRIRKVDTIGIITTVAGDGPSYPTNGSYSGDGGAATNGSLFGPDDVGFDANGNMYIADFANNRVRKVDTNGIITTVAGDGPSFPKIGSNIGSYSGDGGAATNASLFAPAGIGFDVSGNLYVADGDNNRIRKVDTNGIITTVAGAGPSYPTNGPYLSNYYSGDGGAATSAMLGGPASVAFDASGNLYIADSGNGRIREVHFAGFPTFTLTNVNVTNAGNYSVVITSPYGSVTSVVAALTVIIPPQIIASGTNFGFTTNQSGNQSGFGFNVVGTVGQTIVVDGSTNLVDWTPLFTNTAGNTPVYFFDPTSTNFPGRFYRARLP